MGQCRCTFTRDSENNCDGSHKIVKEVREKIATDIEGAHIGEDNEQLNAVGMRIVAAKIARGL
jgi:hypothetical protein